MKLKVTKTDRRHSANHIFQYYVEPEYGLPSGRDGRIELFKELRVWCWEMFGPGCERDFVVVRPVPVGEDGQCRMDSVERWAWLTTSYEKQELRIYLKEEAMTFFKLKWL